MKYYVFLIATLVLLSLGCVESKSNTEIEEDVGSNIDPLLLKIDALADDYNTLVYKDIEIGELYILAETDEELNSVIAKYNSISLEYESYLDECHDIENEIDTLYTDGVITRDDYIFADEYLNDFMNRFKSNAKSTKYMAIATEYYKNEDYDNHDVYYNLAEYYGL